MTMRLLGPVTALTMSVAVSIGCAQQGPPAGDSATSPAKFSVEASQNGSEKTSANSGAAARASGGSSASTKPQFRNVKVPAGTPLNLTLETAVASDKSRAEDPVRAKLSQPILIDSITVVPAGSQLRGSVLEAKQSGRVSGRATVSFRFDRLISGDESYDIHTARIAREARATKGEDAKKIGIGAGAGAVIGAFAGGKKGAAIGSGIGAGAGTGVVLSTRGEEVRLGPGAKLKTTLEDAVTIAVPID